MATDDVDITEDADMAECEGDKVVTMMDVLQEQQEFEDDANAVLGASDDKNCTYAKGYIKRQALYACLTCCPDVKADPTKRAGVCLACSLMCHENHELVELYTKRNFRCDCGNPKFNSHPCQFTPSKPDLNDDNVYNQNFSGLYCICQRPYPDPDAATEEDMIQCIICEDWLHASHLDATVPANEHYSEMICKGCMEKNEFLHDYSNFAVNIASVDVDVLTVNGDKSASFCNGDVTIEISTNTNVENSSEKTATVPNGGDVDMSENKENNEDMSRKEINETEEDKSATLHNTSKEINMNTEIEKETESQSVEPANEETKHNDENIASESENKDDEITKDEPTSESEPSQNASAGDKMESTDVETDAKASESIADTQEQTGQEELANIPKGDRDHENEENTISSKTDENVDSNKTEDQLLDDIKALTSENPSDEMQKSSDVDTTTQPAENSTIEEKSTDNTEQEDKSKFTEDGGDKIEDSSSDQTNDNTANEALNSASETSKTEIPDMSQPKHVETENADDKTDSVMDAIDELLEGPTESNKNDDNKIQPNDEFNQNKESTDNSDQSKANEIEMSENENKTEDNVPDKTDSEQNKDIDMTENKDETTSSGNKTPVDIESTNTETTDSTNKIALAADSTESDLLTDINEKSSDAEINIKTNGDVINENKALPEIDMDNNSKNQPAHNEHKRKLSIELEEETSLKKVKLDGKCVRPKGTKKIYKGATFWPSNFRQKLCTCSECISMYKDLHVLYLTDPEDTVSFYENLGKENVDGVASQYEKGLQALSSLDRIQQINALTEYNRMRDKLLDFLKSFKDRKEVVKEEDIKAFFAGMKPRREQDGVYFCR